MAFSQQTWGEGGQTEVNEVELNRIETGIADAHTIAEGAAALADEALAALDNISVDYTETFENAPAGSTFTIVCAAGAWPTRGSARTDIVFIWRASAVSDPAPPIGGAYAIAGVDEYKKMTA